MSKKLTYSLVLTAFLSLCAGIANADLVAHWKFDEGTGITAFDSSGNGNDGTLEGDPQWVTGQLGGALEGNGTDDLVRVPHSASLDISDAVTVSLWLFGGTPPDQPISKGEWNASYGVRLDDAGGRERQINWRGRGPAAPAPGNSLNSVTALPEDEWVHVAVTFDVGATGNNQKIFINGEVDAENRSENPLSSNADDVRLFAEGWSNTNRFIFGGMLDDIRIYDTALAESEIPAIMKGRPEELAFEPNPDDGATDVPRDVILSWTPGKFAAQHAVYLGTAFDDVNEADIDGSLDTQDANTYDVGVLDFGQTYYWRVDEVNGAPDNTIFKGNVWSFTVEPFAYQIGNVTAASNGTSEAGVGPENTVNGSGLNENGEHSIAAGDMWQATPTGDEALYIEYEFDTVYKLHEMLVWNYNVQFEPMLGFGLKDVAVEYSENGADWTVLGDVTFNQAAATATYTANTTVAFNGVAAKYVRITVNSGYGPLGQFGLSEVRFLYVPVQAREPQPADGETSVAVATNLSWRSGREAVSHEVYLSTEQAAVADGSALIDTTGATTINPGDLDLAATYYWQVTEVNDAEAISTWEGAIWSFSTQEFVVVDDFESYNDEDNLIYESWLDGWVNETGSTVGYLQAPFAETTIVNNGGQAMPLFYDNAGLTVAEATRTLAPPQNWTANGIKSLSLYFHGAQDNTGQLYLKINGTKIVYNGDAGDISKGQWQPWNIDLSDVGGNLSSVSELTIGIEGAGAAGTVYIDDVRLYPKTPEFVTPAEPDPAGLVLYYALDEGSGSVATDASGNGNNGTIEGSPAWIPGVSGTALGFDGSRDYVTTGKSLLSDLTEFTIACWLKDDLSLANRSGLVGQNDCIEYGISASNNVQIWSAGAGAVNLTWPYDADADWHHIVAVGDGQSVTIYLDGKPAVSGGTPIEDTYGASTFPVNIGGGGIFDATDNWFTGDVDEIYIYQRALSAAEVAGLAGRTEPIAVAF